MKKLGKRLEVTKETIEAYSINCGGSCPWSCGAHCNTTNYGSSANAYSAVYYSILGS